MDAHTIQQPIREIDVYTDADGDVLCYRVGRNDITLIEACTKPGLHCDIPYVRVWKNATCEAEFCQHNIIGVYFSPVPTPMPPSPEPLPDIDPDCASGVSIADHNGVSCISCYLPF